MILMLQVDVFYPDNSSARHTLFVSLHAAHAFSPCFCSSFGPAQSGEQFKKEAPFLGLGAWQP